MKINLILLLLLISFSYGCSNTVGDFECFWRGSDCEGSSSESDSDASQNLAEDTNCTVAGIENSSETAEFTIANGESDSVTCNAGYTKSGSISCSSAEATGTITCTPSSCDVTGINNSTQSSNFTPAHGESYTVSCNADYSKIGDAEISCSFGEVTGTAFCMGENDCYVEDPVDNSNQSGGFVVTNGQPDPVECNSGYTKDGSITCAGSPGTASGAVSCKEDCSLSGVTNSDYLVSGSIAGSDGSGGSVDLTVTCDTGYTIDGSVGSLDSETFTCDNGTLTGSLSCNPITCTQDIKHLTIEGQTDTISSVYDGGASSVSISSCASGFKPTATEATCTPDGTFDTTVTCAFVDWLVQLHGNNLFKSIESGSCSTSGTTFVECGNNAGTWTGDGINFTNSDYHNTFTADADGNIYSFGSRSGVDGIIIKMDPDGNVFWRKEYTTATTGIYNGDSNDIFRDSVAVTKTEEGKKVTEVYFTIQTISKYESAGDVTGGLNCAVGKINSDGDIQWIQQLSDGDKNNADPQVIVVGDTSKDDYCGSIAVNGDTLVVGGYSKGTIEKNGPSIESSGQDAFVAKLNASDGSLYWVKQVPEGAACTGGASTGSEVSESECDIVSGTWTLSEADALCMGVAIDDSGNVYCGGTAVGGSMKPGVSAVGGIDLFIAVFDGDGNHLSTYEHGVSGKNTLLNHLMIDDINGDSVVIYGAGKTDGLIQTSETGGVGGGDDGFIMMADFNTTTPAFSNVAYEQLVDADITDASGDESCRRLALDNDKNLYALCYTTGATLGEANDGGTGRKHPLILKLARASTGNISIKGKKQYGDNLQYVAGPPTSGVLQINDTESGDLIEEYTILSNGEGEMLGGSIMVNADGSIYFGSNLNFAFAGNRSSSGDIAPSNGDSIGLKSGSDYDPWVMKIQDCEGVLQLGSSDCSP